MAEYEQVTAGHLGGYTRGGNPATWYPELWTWLIQRLGVRSVLDVGCGEGQSTEFFRTLGCRVLGIEGIPQPSPWIVAHDYVTGPYSPTDCFDLVWSCEFVEHVDERYSGNFLETFRAARRFILMTHAMPGQGGHHHVNERVATYWIERVEALGFRYDRLLTAATRTKSVSNGTPWNHYLHTGLAFRRLSLSRAESLRWLPEGVIGWLADRAPRTIDTAGTRARRSGP
jgi:SAM-dependent methyltransferase